MIGKLIDDLISTDSEMWSNQEILYEIRRMTFSAYKQKYFSSRTGAQRLWSTIQKACTLNIERNKLIDEIDESLVSMIQESFR